MKKAQQKAKDLGAISPKPSQQSLALQGVIASLHAASNMEEVMQHINQGVVQVLRYNGLIVSLLDEDRKVFRWSILHTKKKLKMLANVKAISGIETLAERQYSKFGDTLLDGKLYITHHFRDIAEMSLGKVTTCSAIRKAMGAKTFVSVPLLDKGKVLGCMIIATSKKKVTEEETKLLTVFAAEAAADIRRIELTNRNITEFKRTEAESLAVINAMPDAVIVLDLNGVILSVNPALTKMLGYKPEERIGKSFDELRDSIKAEDIERFWGLLGELVETGRVEPMETVLRAKDGREIPTSVTYSLIKDAEGNPTNIIALLRDITETKRLQEKEKEALVLAERAATLDAMIDGVLMHDLEGKIVSANKALEDMAGYKKDEYQGKSLLEFLKPEELEKSRAALAELLEKSRVGPIEVTLPTKDGREIPIQTISSLVRDALGNPTHGVVMIRDITERKKAEVELREAYQELEATQQELIALQKAASSIQATQELDQILQQLADGITQGTSYDVSAIFLLDEDEKVFRLATIAPIPEMLPFIEKIPGYKPAEFTIPANGNYSETVRMILEGQVIRTHDLYDITAPRLNRAACSALQGFIKAKSVLAVPMIANGKVVGAFVVTTQQEQISERRIESLVSFANQAASVVENARLLDIEGKEQQRNALLLAIGHEFKVPLTSIKTMGSLLAEELKGDGQNPWARMVGNIRRSADKMERRLADLLDFARMRTATVELQLQPTNVKAAIEEATSLCLPFTLSKKQTLEVDVPDSLPSAVLDQLRFERIITNLLTNASKFTPEGGKIRLRAREKNSNLTVEVRDSGVGIPKSELGLIFKPYYRGKASEPSSSGLGLGLAIVEELVKLHQGKVWVESKPGKGSIFTFSLPLRDGRSAELGKRDKER